MAVVHQRVEAGFAIAGTHRHQGYFAAKGHKAFEDAGHATQFGKGADHIFGLAQHLLSLAVIAQGAGLHHCRQADGGHGRIQIGLRLDIGELRGGNAQILEHGFFKPAVAGDTQGLGAGIDRDELGEEGHGFGRHAFEFEGDQIHFIGQLAQVILIAVIGADMLAQGGGAGIRRRVEEGEVHPQRGACQGQHAAQLAATDYTDLHRIRPRVGPGFPEQIRSARRGTP